MVGGVSLFLAVFLIGWMDEREDRYCGLKKLEGSTGKYRSWEERRSALNRSRHALDISISNIKKNGEIILEIKEPYARRMALEEWENLINSLKEKD